MSHEASHENFSKGPSVDAINDYRYANIEPPTDPLLLAQYATAFSLAEPKVTGGYELDFSFTSQQSREALKSRELPSSP